MTRFYVSEYRVTDNRLKFLRVFATCEQWDDAEWLANAMNRSKDFDGGRGGYTSRAEREVTEHDGAPTNRKEDQ